MDLFFGRLTAIFYGQIFQQMGPHLGSTSRYSSFEKWGFHHYTGWWFQIFLFSPLYGEMIQFD